MPKHHKIICACNLDPTCEACRGAGKYFVSEDIFTILNMPEDQYIKTLAALGKMKEQIKNDV